MTLTYPTIHLNGTARESLLEQLSEARAALQDARDKLEAASPHARDYYMRGFGAFEKARDEHLVRMRCVERARDELEEIMLAIVDAP